MERIERVREFIDRKKVDSVMTKNQSNIFYLTGLLEIEGYLIIDKKNTYLLTSKLYLQEAIDNLKGEKNRKINVIEFNPKNIEKILSNYKKVILIKTEFTYQSYLEWKEKLREKLILLDDFISDLRMEKTEEEIKLIKKAEEISEKTFTQIEERIKEGVKEIDIVSEIKYLLIKNGARKESFDPIVASGVNSSYPHHKPKNKEIKNGEVVVIDFGADYNGYKSDLTKTFFCGKVDDEIKRIYGVVDETRKICIEYLNEENLKCKELYKRAVLNFKKYNISKFFVHGLGHGVGIDVHEKPYLNNLSRDKIKKGYVFTIEPGIYIPGKFGIRLESMVYKI